MFSAEKHKYFGLGVHNVNYVLCIIMYTDLNLNKTAVCWQKFVRRDNYRKTVFENVTATQERRRRTFLLECLTTKKTGTSNRLNLGIRAYLAIRAYT